MCESGPRSPSSCLSYAVAIMVAAWCATVRAAPEVAVVLSEESPAYLEVAETIRAELDRGAGAPATVKIVLASGFNGLPRGDLQAIVAVGAKAAREAADEKRLPVLNTLVPRRTFERIAAENGRTGDPRRFSAVFLDQPPTRQIEFIRQALPGATRIALLLGTESEPLYAMVQAAAIERRLRTSAQKAGTENELYPALQQLLGEADVLLALPDPSIFNSSTIPNILLTTYRHHLPVVGFSAAYLRAGAVLALYSTPAQIGQQAADLLRVALATGQLPPPQHPLQFTVGTNPHVARSLGLAIEDAATLAQKLRQAEAQ